MSYKCAKSAADRNTFPLSPCQNQVTIIKTLLSADTMKMCCDNMSCLIHPSGADDNRRRLLAAGPSPAGLGSAGRHIAALHCIQVNTASTVADIKTKSLSLRRLIFCQFKMDFVEIKAKCV